MKASGKEMARLIEEEIERRNQHTQILSSWLNNLEREEDVKHERKQKRRKRKGEYPLATRNKLLLN